MQRQFTAVLIIYFVVLPTLAQAQNVAVPAPEVLKHEFPVPEALESAVEFWVRLFTVHSSDRVVIHDRENMDVVWQVLELPKDESGAVDEIAAVPVARAAMDELRQRLLRLEQTLTPIDDDDRVLFALVGGDVDRLVGAAQRLRAQRGVADKFRDGARRARLWFEDMVRILGVEGVPPQFVVLPFVESMYNPFARSSVGALGLWQLMPATARSLGLKVGNPADERLDVHKATRAAGKMLRQNFRMLGTWPLAVTAYNHGPNGVRRAVREVGSTDLTILIEQYDRLTWGFASKNFYAEFLAAIRVFSEHEPDFANLLKQHSPDQQAAL